MSGHLLSDELRKRLRINICDKLLFGNGTPPAADDLWNALSGRMSPSTEFCTAIRSIMNYESSNETCGTDGAFEKTYDWNENTQNFTNHAHEEKNKGIELVRQSVTRTAPPKYLKKTKMCKYCVFCRNNNEPEYVYKSHQTRDIQNRISCSRLRAYVCPICGQSGDNAHTIKYCPKKPILTNEKIEAHNLCKHPH